MNTYLSIIAIILSCTARIFALILLYLRHIDIGYLSSIGYGISSYRSLSGYSGMFCSVISIELLRNTEGGKL